MGKKLKPLTLESAKEGYQTFLKKNKIKESETPSDSELAAKKAGWETKIKDLEASKGSKKKAGKEEGKKKAKKSAGARESKKYEYPADCTSADDRKKFRTKARAAAKGGAKKKAKVEGTPEVKKSKKKKKKTSKED